jgi:hypothetical protein
MSFASDLHREVFEKVRVWLGELVGSDNVFEHGELAFVIYRGSAKIFVGVFTRSDPEDIVINIRLYIVVGPRLDNDLFEYLIRENFNLVYGAFAIDKDNDIVFDQTIPGRGADADELKVAVGAVSWTADKYDDEISSRWGGKTAKMMWEEARKKGDLKW